MGFDAAFLSLPLAVSMFGSVSVLPPPSHSALLPDIDTSAASATPWVLGLILI